MFSSIVIHSQSVTILKTFSIRDIIKKKLNPFSNKMFEKSTGLTAPNTSEYEDEPYSYNSSAPSSVYIQQSSGTQYIRQSVSFTNAFRAGFFFTLGCMVAGIIPFIIVYMMLMGSLQQQTSKYV